MNSLIYYNNNGEDYYKSTVDLNLNSLYREFLVFVGKEKKILDLGCGSGRDSKFFFSLGHKVTSIDGSKSLVKLATQHIGQRVLLMDFSEIKFENEFDGIWACASLLHVPKKNIRLIFNLIKRAIKPDGYFFVSFKYGEKETIKDLRLFNNYTEKSFSKFISSQKGYKIVKIWTSKDLRCDHTETIWLNIILKCIK